MLLPYIPGGGEDVNLVLIKHRAEPCDSSWLSLLTGEGGLDCLPFRKLAEGLLASIRTQAWVGISSPSLSAE